MYYRFAWLSLYFLVDSVFVRSGNDVAFDGVLLREGPKGDRFLGGPSSLALQPEVPPPDRHQAVPARRCPPACPRVVPDPDSDARRPDRLGY